MWIRQLNFLKLSLRWLLTLLLIKNDFKPFLDEIKTYSSVIFHAAAFEIAFVEENAVLGIDILRLIGVQSAFSPATALTNLRQAAEASE